MSAKKKTYRCATCEKQVVALAQPLTHMRKVVKCCLHHVTLSSAALMAAHKHCGHYDHFVPCRGRMAEVNAAPAPALITARR